MIWTSDYGEQRAFPKVLRVSGPKGLEHNYCSISCILFCSTLFCSILFYSILFYSILFYSLPLHLFLRKSDIH